MYMNSRRRNIIEIVFILFPVTHIMLLVSPVQTVHMAPVVLSTIPIK